MTSDELSGNVALITGAARGIGRHLAEGLAAAGMSIACVGRTKKTLDEVVESLGVPAIGVAADVTDREAVGAAVAEIESEFGRIDLLVNNAGLIESTTGPMWEIDPDEWWRVVEVDLRGPMLMARAVIPGMIARGSGRIVGLNSGMGTRARPEYSAYSVAKTGLARLTEALAGSLAGTGVTTFEVAPGVIRTDMTQSMPMWDGFDGWTPPERVVGMVAAIASGRLDALSGRFFRASTDEVDDLLAHADRILAADARVVRLRPYGDDDPLG